MSLQIWLPLLGTLNNNGVSNSTITTGNTTVSTAGKIGSCYSFNGSTSYIDMTHTDLPTWLNGDFSVCMWIYNNDGGGRSIFFGNYSMTGSFFNIEKTTGEKVRFYWNGSPDSYANNTTITSGAWTHLVITRQGSTVKFYANGTLTDTITTTLSGTIPTNATTFRLGRDGRSDSTAFNGRLNDFRLYNHCLSAKEVQLISHALLIHYPLSNNGSGCANLVANSYVNTTSSAYGFGTKNFSITEGKTYTVSARGYISDAAVSSGTKLAVYFYKSDWSYCPVVLTINSTTPETKYATFTADRTATMTINSYSFKGQGTAGDPVTAIWYKVEEGSSPTPWLPNSSDTAYTTMGYNSTTEYDTSGYLHNGTRVGTFSWSSDTPRYSVSTNFTSGPYTYTTIPLGSFADNYTFAAWINNPKTNESIMFGYADGNRLNFEFWNNTDILWNTHDGTAAKFGSLNPTNYKNVWHHYVITGDGTTVKLYIDGEFAANCAKYKSITGTQLYFNGHDSTTSYRYNGSMSDFRMYATCLDATSIKELYNTSASLTNNGRLLSYSFNEG